MKFKSTKVEAGVNILANDHYVAVNYDCSDSSGLANEEGVIVAGTIVPANDSTAEGVVLKDIYVDENSNGAVIVHGFINTEKLPTQVTDEAKAVLNLIKFM